MRALSYKHQYAPALTSIKLLYTDPIYLWYKGHCKLLLGSNRADSPLSVLNLTSSGSEVLTGLSVLSWRRVMREEYLDNGTWFTGAVRNYTTFTTDNNLLKVCQRLLMLLDDDCLHIIMLSSSSSSSSSSSCLQLNLYHK
jgi:hypothetical protein